MRQLFFLYLLPFAHPFLFFLLRVGLLAYYTIQPLFWSMLTSYAKFWLDEVGYITADMGEDATLAQGEATVFHVVSSSLFAKCRRS